MFTCDRCGRQAVIRRWWSTGAAVCAWCAVPDPAAEFLAGHAELADLAALFDRAELSGLFS